MRPSLKEFTAVCNAKSGIVASIASYYKVARKTIYDWCNKNEKFHEALHDARESFLDVAESNLQTLVKGIPKIEEDENGVKRLVGWIERPSEKSIHFVLKTLGKHRGYVEKIQTEDVTNPFLELMKSATDDSD